MRSEVVWYLGAVNVAAFVAVFIDKRRARLRRRRIRESTLHLLALAGGSLGTMLGMHMLRHKTRKVSFRIALGAIVVLHGALLVWWVLEVRRG